MRESLPDKLRLLVIASCLGVLGCNSTAAESEVTKLPQELRAYDSAKVTRTSIASPVGRFLLVRRGTMSCVLKFTSFHREGEYKYAEYDWFHQVDGSNDFTRGNISSGHGRVSDTPSIGIGKLAFKLFANSHIMCGALEMVWGYPISIGFFRYIEGSWRQDDQLEIAPTKLDEIRNVNLSDSRLKWYKVSGDRPPWMTFVPLADLPY